MLGAYVEKKGVSLLGDTGVTEKDIVAVLPIFSCWMENNPNANILDFFRSRKRISDKVLRALATIGLHTVVAELNRIAELDEAMQKDKEGSRE